MSLSWQEEHRELDAKSRPACPIVATSWKRLPCCLDLATCRSSVGNPSSEHVHLGCLLGDQSRLALRQDQDGRLHSCGDLHRRYHKTYKGAKSWRRMASK